MDSISKFWSCMYMSCVCVYVYIYIYTHWNTMCITCFGHVLPRDVAKLSAGLSSSLSKPSTWEMPMVDPGSAGSATTSRGHKNPFDLSLRGRDQFSLKRRHMKWHVMAHSHYIHLFVQASMTAWNSDLWDFSRFNDFSAGNLHESLNPDSSNMLQWSPM